MPFLWENELNIKTGDVCNNDCVYYNEMFCWRTLCSGIHSLCMSHRT